MAGGSRFPALLDKLGLRLAREAEVVGALGRDYFTHVGDLGDDGEIVFLSLLVDVAGLGEGADQVVVHARR